MKRRLRMTRRIRLRLALLAILALLCQQVAFAAYVCPVMAMPPTDTAMSADCNAMPMAAPKPDTQAAATLCELHGAQPATMVNHLQLPSVPPVLLPAMLPTPSLVATLSAVPDAYEHNHALRTSGLPPPLKYRVLLI